jgi:carbamoyltransferase
MVILGLGGLTHDAAAALMVEGEIEAAVEEAKLTRGTSPGLLPQAAIKECLRITKLNANDIDCVTIARPFAQGPEANLYLELRHLFPKAEIDVLDHHLAHAASAAHGTHLGKSTVLVLDNAGDFCCGSLWSSDGRNLQLNKQWFYPDSLGRLYSAVTEYLGFRAGAEEHKVQWLSTAGDDRLVPLFREIASEGARIDESFFDASGRLNARFAERVAGAKPETIARGLQKTVEETVIAMAGQGENLALAGGLFLNALVVEALERSGRWKKVHVQPAAGNAGTAMGAAYYSFFKRGGRAFDFNCSLIKGPSYSADEIKQVLENCKLRFQFLQSNDELVATAVRLLGENKIIAWMQGPMEFGPRALGNRSILASPLNPYSTENLNVFIKHREPFRKFAASVPEELASTYFDVVGWNARNLATVSRVKPEYRKTFESAILGEDMARVHTAFKSENPLFHRLLLEAGKATGLPVLYNTSFNLFGDPLVATPRDAVRSFYSSGIDALFAGNFLLEK